MGNINSKLIQEDFEFKFKSELIHAQVENEELVLKNHQKLIDAATKLFSKLGYHSTTIRQIVKESGIGIGSIYQYVKNKEEILVLILEYIFKRFEFRLSLAMEMRDLDEPIQKLRTGIESYYRLIDKEYEKIILAYSSTISLSKEYRAFVKELELKTNNIFEEILKDGIEKGHFKKDINVPIVAYDIIMYGHMWALKRWYFNKNYTINEYIKIQTGHILNIISYEND